MSLKNIFGRFQHNKKAIKPPHKVIEAISWNEIVKECYNKNLEFMYPVSKVIYDNDKAERAVILQKSDALFTIVFEKLYPFDDDELSYTDSDIHDYWSPNTNSMNSVFDSAEAAARAIFSEPPFKYNKQIIWADAPFRIDAENLCWIKDDGNDDPDDFCLHGRATAKIGDEFFEYDATVSATALYLLRTLRENHILHECEHMLPCCGHTMISNEDCSSVDICGCPNGVDWSVMHEHNMIKLVTETGAETLIDIDAYTDEVFSFADKIEVFYKNSLQKNLAELDDFSRNGYTAFWNEWRRRRYENIGST